MEQRGFGIDLLLETSAGVGASSTDSSMVSATHRNAAPTLAAAPGQPPVLGPELSVPPMVVDLPDWNAGFADTYARLGAVTDVNDDDLEHTNSVHRSDFTSDSARVRDRRNRTDADVSNYLAPEGGDDRVPLVSRAVEPVGSSVGVRNGSISEFGEGPNRSVQNLSWKKARDDSHTGRPVSGNASEQKLEDTEAALDIDNTDHFEAPFRPGDVKNDVGQKQQRNDVDASASPAAVKHEVRGQPPERAIRSIRDVSFASVRRYIDNDEPFLRNITADLLDRAMVKLQYPMKPTLKMLVVSIVDGIVWLQSGGLRENDESRRFNLKFRVDTMKSDTSVRRIIIQDISAVNADQVFTGVVIYPDQFTVRYHVHGNTKVVPHAVAPHFTPTPWLSRRVAGERVFDNMEGPKHVFYTSFGLRNEKQVSNEAQFAKKRRLAEDDIRSANFISFALTPRSVASAVQVPPSTTREFLEQQRTVVNDLEILEKMRSAGTCGTFIKVNEQVKKVVVLATDEQLDLLRTMAVEHEQWGRAWFPPSVDPTYKHGTHVCFWMCVKRSGRLVILWMKRPDVVTGHGL